MLPLWVYNTALGQKEVFTPRQPGVVNLYVCGPTVYDYLHVGNFRGAIFFNFVRNFLEHEGYRVNFAYNYTDVDDKILKKAQELQQPPLEVSEFFIQEFQKDYQALRLRPHTHNPKVSEYIPQMVQYVQDILDRDMAYIADGSVYLRRHRLAAVGALSGRHIDDGQVGDKNELGVKEHASDFALWKAAADNELGWSAPWGRGRPGWHLECSVMIHEIFHGQPLDIHGGGLDLLFPHHENECAQCAARGQSQLARYWLHNNMLNLGGAKMAKSVGNVLTGRAFILEHSPELLKFVMLAHHYRSVIDFSPDQIQTYRAQMAAIYSALKKAHSTSAVMTDGFADLQAQAWAALRDDFNTPMLLSYVHEAVNRFYKQPNQAANFLGFMQALGPVWGLFQEDPVKFSQFLDRQDLGKLKITEAEIELAIQQRAQFRAQRDFASADAIREQLKAQGLNLLDVAGSTTWEVIR